MPKGELVSRSTKHEIGRAAAIISIVVNALAIVACIVMIAVFASNIDIVEDLLDIDWQSVRLVIIFISILLLISIAALIIASIFCSKTNSTSLAITLMIFSVFTSTITLILMIIYFCTKNEARVVELLPQEQPATQTLSPQAHNYDQKIAMLRRLREQGDLTEKEFKDLLLKEIQK